MVNSLPAPDSEAMGYWVDRWLHYRRMMGASERELGQLARQLADAAQGSLGTEAIWSNFCEFYRKANSDD